MSASCLGCDISLTYPSCKTQFRKPLLLLFGQCILFMSLLSDLTLFSSCIPIKCRTFVLLYMTVLLGTSMSSCTWHLKEGTANFHRNWKTMVEKRRISVTSHVQGLPYNGHVKHLAPESPTPSSAGRHGGNAGTVEISPGQIFMRVTCSASEIILNNKTAFFSLKKLVRSPQPLFILQVSCI